eukprot:TRINITY_DN4404_c0_g1_i1.p1 TRINITY_DN4404_c0_g1~~TRINITY_DN4404_c0_g1_i1.p1  ORF type:complete len:642 (-),score=135.12 TRINITY_DN4404_c0_g1_i1:25-1908(-)
MEGETTHNIPQTLPKTAENQSQNQPQENLNDLAVIGNCSLTALVDKKGCIVWCCLPRFDADPVFCSLLRRTRDTGFFEVDLQNCKSSTQSYIKNTPILQTTLTDSAGNGLDIVDFAPRFRHYGRDYRPMMIIRMITPHKGTRPTVRVRVRPTFGYGWGSPEKTRGSNHIRYLIPTGTIRLTTNAPISYILQETRFLLEEPMYLLLMPDESITSGLAEFVASNLESTKQEWRGWTSNLTIPFEFQSDVIRAAITLKLCHYEETGAMVSAMTTSVPISPAGVEQIDSRYAFVQTMPLMIRTLTDLGQSSTVNGFLVFLSNILGLATAEGSKVDLQPVYGISMETLLHQKEVHRLAGYRGLGPVVVGNDMFQHKNNTVYGSLILALTPCFFDERLNTPGDKNLFDKMAQLGEILTKVYKEPSEVSSLGHHYLCKINDGLHILVPLTAWAGCDRLARISVRLQLKDEQTKWRAAADTIKQFIYDNFVHNDHFVVLTGENKKSAVVDEHLLRMPEYGLVSYTDPLFKNTLKVVETELLTREGLMGTRNKDGGRPDSAVLLTPSFWYVNSLWETGRRDEARALFDRLLKARNVHGIYGESIGHDGQLWGNFPGSLSLAALISTASRLSSPWQV